MGAAAARHRRRRPLRGAGAARRTPPTPRRRGHAGRAEGQEQLDAGRDRLGQVEGQLAGGRALLDQLVAANPDDPTIPGLQAQLDEGAAKLESGRADLAGPRTSSPPVAPSTRTASPSPRATEGTRLVSEDGRHAVAQVRFDENAQSVPPRTGR